MVVEHLRNTAPFRDARDAPSELAVSRRVWSIEVRSSALDLLLGRHALRRVEVLPHARVVAQQGGGAVPELLSDVCGGWPS
jgi:hypothetical protein